MWVPYARYDPGRSALVVVANPSRDTKLQLRLSLPLERLGLDTPPELQVLATSCLLPATCCLLLATCDLLPSQSDLASSEPQGLSCRSESSSVLALALRRSVLQCGAAAVGRVGRCGRGRGGRAAGVRPLRAGGLRLS